jgi:hypothetical protein
LDAPAADLSASLMFATITVVRDSSLATLRRRTLTPFPGECLSIRIGCGIAPQREPMVRGLGANGEHGAAERAGNRLFRLAVCRKAGKLPHFVLGPTVAS